MIALRVFEVYPVGTASAPIRRTMLPNSRYGRCFTTSSAFVSAGTPYAPARIDKLRLLLSGGDIRARGGLGGVGAMEAPII